MAPVTVAATMEMVAVVAVTATTPNLVEQVLVAILAQVAIRLLLVEQHQLLDLVVEQQVDIIQVVTVHLQVVV